MIKVKSKNEIWNKMGCNETPIEIVDEFSEFVTKNFYTYYKRKLQESNLSILDLFSGDGRLGNKISKNLSSRFKSIHLVFVEVYASKTVSIKPPVSSFKVINMNAFKWNSKEKFDLVVSNPPYKILNARKAEDLGFSWEFVKKFSRNLFGLGIIKGLELCKENGILAVIAPFSWLKGVFCEDFRHEINLRCSDVIINAYKHRGIFNGINQDIGFQFFIKRGENKIKKTEFNFKYDGFKSVKFFLQDSKDSPKSSIGKINVKVGPIVWNRQKKFLTSKKIGSVLLIYGGNIRPSGKLDLKVTRYSKKQYIKKNELNSICIFKSPLILLRRTMRGTPGNWKIDSCLITNRFSCAVENHVIVIMLPSKKNRYDNLHRLLIDELLKYYYVAGSPTISVKVVRKCLYRVLDLDK